MGLKSGTVLTIVVCYSIKLTWNRFEIFLRNFHWHCELNASCYRTLLGLCESGCKLDSLSTNMRRADVSKLIIANPTRNQSPYGATFFFYGEKKGENENVDTFLFSLSLQ
jgi:hypothetical protein